MNKNNVLGCTGELTWLIVLDDDPLSGYCDWEKPSRVTETPEFLYCPGSTACKAKGKPYYTFNVINQKVSPNKCVFTFIFVKPIARGMICLKN